MCSPRVHAKGVHTRGEPVHAAGQIPPPSRSQVHLRVLVAGSLGRHTSISSSSSRSHHHQHQHLQQRYHHHTTNTNTNICSSGTTTTPPPPPPVT